MLSIVNAAIPSPKNLPYERVVKISGIVTDDAEYKKGNYYIKLKTDFGQLYVMLDSNPNIQRSDELKISGKLQEGFGDYAGFIYHPTIISVAKPVTSDLALSLRNLFSQNVTNSIQDPDQNSLALSYLTGQKNLLSEEQKQKLRLVGLSHVVVASGYHLSVVVGLAKRLFRKISRLAVFGGATIFIIAYISVTGFSPSMVRAGFIAMLSLLTWYFGRKMHPVRTIIYAMAASLIIDPNYITNLAWQLSFASYAGIIIFSPVLTTYLYKDEKPGYFASLIIASISAQLFCLPFTIYNFGSIPCLALVANILVTPTIPIVMLLTFLVGITNFHAIAFIASKLLAFHLGVVDWLSSFSWASLEVPTANPFYFLLFLPILVVLYILKKRTNYSYRPSYGKICAC